MTTRSGKERGRRRSGTAMLLIIVTMAVIVAVIMAVLPTLVRLNRIERAQKTARIFADLSRVLYNTDGAVGDFRQFVNRNAGKLSNLRIPITTSDRTSCTGTNFQNPQPGNWFQVNGITPYAIEQNYGLMTPMGLAVDPLVRTPNSATLGTLAIQILNADYEDVEILDMLVDTSDPPIGFFKYNDGLIRWGLTGTDGTKNPDGTTTLSYTFQIDNSC
jgi:hypothetical protein